MCRGGGGGCEGAGDLETGWGCCWDKPPPKMPALGVRAPHPLLGFPHPMPVAGIKFGPIVRAFSLGAWLRVAGRLGMRRRREGDPGCGRTAGRREGPPGGTGRGSRGLVWYLESERRCRLVLHNTGREGEGGGGRAVGGERGKLCFLL